jgi:glycosyltransferase involved in cell wall biosynthesis
MCYSERSPLEPIREIQAELLAVPQELHDVANALAADDHHCLANSHPGQRLDRVVDHRAVVDGQEVLIRDHCEREQARRGPACEHKALHRGEASSSDARQSAASDALRAALIVTAVQLLHGAVSMRGCHHRRVMGTGGNSQALSDDGERPTSVRMQPSTLLFLHSSDEAYGSDRVLLTLVTGVKEAGHQAHVLLPDDAAPGWLSAQLDAAGISHSRGPMAVARRRYLRPRNTLHYLRLLMAARRFVRVEAVRHGARVIHINTTALLVGAFLGRPGGARRLWHVHEIVRSPKLLALVFRSLPLAAADRVVAVSDAVARNLIGRRFRRYRLRVVHNGIPPERFVEESERPVHDWATVVYIGRLNRWKGYEDFVAAASIVARSRPSARFVVAGDPPPGDEWRSADLRTRIDEAGVGSVLEMRGFVDDTRSLLRDADIVVIPSREPDPLNLVALEAMAAGCAIVATNHGGLPELIHDGKSGLLVPPGDVAALAFAIDRLLADALLRARLGAAARIRARAEFSVDQFVSRMLEIVNETAQQP